MPKLRMNDQVSSYTVEGFSPVNMGFPLDDPLSDMNPHTFFFEFV